MKTLTFFTALTTLIFSYGNANACHRFVCIYTDCLDTVIVCRQDRNTSGLDPLRCNTFNVDDPNRPQCRLDPQYGDIVIEQECPPCPECPTCEECKECPTCEECKECPEPPKCPEGPDAGPNPVPDAGPSSDTGPCEDCEDPEEDIKALAGGCSMNGTGNPFAGTGLLFLILSLVCVSFAHKSKKLLMGIAGAIILCAGGLVYGLPTQNLRPAPGSFDYLETQDGRLSLPSAKLFWHYERNPLVINQKPGNNRIDEIIEARHSLHVLVSASWDRFQLSLDLPVVLGQEQWPYETLQNGVGDLRALVKARLYTYKSLNVAMALEGTFPTATADHVGEKNGSFSPKVIVSGKLGPVDLAANLGFLLRSNETFTDPGFQRVGLGQVFLASAAARIPLVQKGKYSLSFLTDLSLSTTLTNTTQEEVPLEWLNALSVGLPKGFSLLTGGSFSITRGIGSPQPRIFASVGWTWEKCKKCKPRTIIKEKTVIKKVKEIVVQHHLVTIPPIYFDTDKATLRPKSKKILDRVAKILKRFPQIDMLRVEGYCDHRASKKYNVALSSRRTKAAVDYLASKGIKVEKIERRNYGENFRVGSDLTDNGMQKNRRVEFYIRSK